MLVSSNNGSSVPEQMSGNDEVPVERGSEEWRGSSLTNALGNKFRSFTGGRTSTDSGVSQSKQGGTQPRVGIMPDVEGLKKDIKEKMTKEPYDVAIYYKKTGFASWLATHKFFEQATLSVILLNAIWIFVDTDYNPGENLLESPQIFQIVEHLFCIYFSFEWSIRFAAFKNKCNGLKDAWFVFDTFLVSTMVFETWGMTAFIVFFAGSGGGSGLGDASILKMGRLLRLARMTRMARLLRAMPELLILVKGMVAAMRSVGFTLGLLFVILYVFGIGFVQLCTGTECQDFFPDVPTTMHCLLLNAVLMDDLSLLVEPLQEQSYLLLFVLYLFILIAGLTVMNMLIGVICEVVSAVAATEREALSLGYVREKMLELYEKGGADKDGDQRISKQEFRELLQNDVATSLFHDVGVDVVGLVDFVDTIFEKEANETDEEGSGEGSGEKTLSFGDFLEVILDLRGGNTATVKDMVQLRKSINARFESLEKRFSQCGNHFSCSTGQAGLPPRSTSKWAQRPSEDIERASAPGAQVERVDTPSPISRLFTHGTFCDSKAGWTQGCSPTDVDASRVAPQKSGDFQSPRATSPARSFSPTRGAIPVGHHQSSRFQDLVHDTQRALLRAHELEVASLRRENKQLLEKLDQHARLGMQLGNGLGSGQQSPKYDRANSRQSHFTPNGNSSPNSSNNMEDLLTYFAGSGQSFKAQNLQLRGIHEDKVVTAGANLDGHAAPVVDLGERRWQQAIEPDDNFHDPTYTETPQGLARAMRGAASLTMRAFSLGGGNATSTSEGTVQNARFQEADPHKMRERFT